MLVAAGLGVGMMGYNGINALIGLKTGSPLLIMIVPISPISFGVDYLIHGRGRAREKQVASSATTFLSNSVSGIQAIIEFGIAAAIGLALCYLVLCRIVPKLMLSVESRLGPHPADLSHLRTRHRRSGSSPRSPEASPSRWRSSSRRSAGPSTRFSLLLLLDAPFLFTRRRNRRAAEAERPLPDEVRGAGCHHEVASSILRRDSQRPAPTPASSTKTQPLSVQSGPSAIRSFR